MLDILFLVFNAAIFNVYAKLLLRWGITRCAERFILAFFLLMVQIIGSLLFLGTIGQLRFIPAIVTNLIIILSVNFFVPSTPNDHHPVSGWGMWKVIQSPLSN